MEKIFEKNITIAKFMGWGITELPLDEKYPTQRWFRTDNSINGEWDSSRCVHTTSDNFDEEVNELKKDLWEKICNPKYGRTGQYHKSYDKLMGVVERLELMGYKLNTFGISDMSKSYYTVITKDDENLAFISNNYELSRIESIFMVVSDVTQYLENKLS